MRFRVSAVLTFAVVLVAGCAIFHHKKPTPPEAPPSVGIETEFRDRWIDRRVHDLIAANSTLSEADARTTAAAEFAKQYPFLRTVNGGNKP